jgi:TonB-dependent receptor
MNVRAAYTKTLARPTFREISTFESYDFNGGNKFVGNPDLKRTLIDNVDLRWEWFSRPGEIYALSAFYKEFQNPIELTIKGDESSDATNIAFTWKNVTAAKVTGVEFELRKSLDIITPVLKDFKFGSNISIIHSTVDIDTSEFDDIQDKRLDASSTRPFQGQSPYLINLSLNYDNIQSGISASLYYNIFGERLSIVSLSGTPDVYEQPYGLLNASFSMPVWNQFSLRIRANNILDSEEKKSQEFRGKEYIYRLFKRGRSFSFGISYKFAS